MKRVGLLAHGAKPEARTLAGRVAGWLTERGHRVLLTAEDAAALDRADAATPREGFADLDLLVVLGGDGTVLHGVELAGFSGVPILGVNLGRLGFLTEVGPESVFEALETAIRGEYALDERSTVSARIVAQGGGDVDLGQAINEVSVERSVGGKMIRMALTLAGQHFTTVGADGLIVATPTGSTAYAFSMRGPVVSPEMRCLVVVAVGAHTLFDRPLVVDEGCDVEVAVQFGGRGIVVMDGRPRTELKEGDVLRACVGPSTVRLVRFGPDTYFTRVAQKFGLPGSAP